MSNFTLALFFLALLTFPFSLEAQNRNKSDHSPKEIQKWIDRLTEGKGKRINREAMAQLIKIGKPALPALGRMLKKEDQMARVSAAMVLKKMGPPAKSAWKNVLLLLEAKDARERAFAIEVLGAIEARNKEVARALYKALEDKNRKVSRKATMALGTMGKEGVDFLVKALEEGTDEVKALALRALNISQNKWYAKKANFEIPDISSSFPALGQTLNHPNGTLQKLSLEVLEQMGPKAAPAATQVALKLFDKRQSLRRKALYTLKKMRGDGKNYLKKSCQGKGKRALAAAVALGALGTSNDRVLSQLGQGLKEKEPIVQAAAALALANLEKRAREGKGIEKALIENLEVSEPKVRICAAIALVQIESKETKKALPVLRNALAGGGGTLFRWPLEMLAVKALGKMGEKAAPAVNELIASLDTHNANLKDEIVKTLAMIGPRAIPALVRALTTKKSENIRPDFIRRSAAQAVIKMGKTALPHLEKIRKKSQTKEEINAIDRVVEKIKKSLKEGEKSH